MPKAIWASQVIALFGFLVGCAAPLYDDQTDKLVTQLQTDVETEITTLITLDEEVQDLAGKTDAASKAAFGQISNCCWLECEYERIR
jgi:hypothetical protein